MARGEIYEIATKFIIFYEYKRNNLGENSKNLI